MKEMWITLLAFAIVALSVFTVVSFEKIEAEKSNRIEKYVVLPQSINLALNDSSIYKNLSNGDTLYRFDPDTALWRGYRYTVKIETLQYLELDSIWWKQFTGLSVDGR